MFFSIIKSIALMIVIWITLMEAGGAIYEINACGGVGECGDDLGGGLVMVTYAVASACVSMAIGLVYFIINTRRKK